MRIESPLFAALHWDLETVARQQEVRSLSGSCTARYPVKLFRYWFMYNLIRNEAARLDRPLRVCEIGTDRGQMLGFARTAGNIAIERWDAVDYRLRPELNNFGYTGQIEVDVETDGFGLDETYDVVVVLHLLEHLLEPEKLLKRLSLHMQRNGIVVGGFPVTPQWAAPAWEKRLRRKIHRDHGNYGHVSVFSPQRVRDMGEDNGFNLEFLSGAFLIRKTGAAIENSSLWARLNLLWGATMPSLGGEIYWQMRRN